MRLIPSESSWTHTRRVALPEHWTVSVRLAFVADSSLLVTFQRHLRFLLPTYKKDLFWQSYANRNTELRTKVQKAKIRMLKKMKPHLLGHDKQSANVQSLPNCSPSSMVCGKLWCSVSGSLRAVNAPIMEINPMITRGRTRFSRPWNTNIANKRQAVWSCELFII